MSCSIILQDQGTFRPGSTISGHVLCTFDSQKKIRGVTVKLRGREYTSWTESESYIDSQTNETKYRDVTYTGDKKFLSFNIFLVGERTMSPGHYEYPFTFTLPRNLPMNYQGYYGFVKYYIKATVDIPFAFDYEYTSNFTVYAPIDFNDIRSQLQMEPCSYQDEKMICCCCCASGSITVDVDLPKEAFVLGEVVRIKIEAINMSNENIEGVHVKLKQTIVSKTTSPSTKIKYDSELLAATPDTGVGAHGERTYELLLEIPRSAGVYNFSGCTLFSQSFVLKVEICMPAFHTNMGIKTVVTVGHIPLDVAQDNPTPQTISFPSSAISGDALPPPPTYTQDDQPPAYLASNEAPPYPTGPPGFPLPSTTPGHIGFISPAGIPPVPVHGGPPYPSNSGSSGNAPLDDTAPSAPTQMKATGRKEIVVANNEGTLTGLSNVPPPTYYDAVRVPSSNLQGVHSYDPGEQIGASAPLLK